MTKTTHCYVTRVEGKDGAAIEYLKKDGKWTFDKGEAIDLPEDCVSTFIKMAQKDPENAGYAIDHIVDIR